MRGNTHCNIRPAFVIIYAIKQMEPNKLDFKFEAIRGFYKNKKNKKERKPT